MTAAKNTKADIEARASRLAFPAPDDWKNIAHDLKLTKAQEKELEVTIQHVLADIEKYQAIERKEPSRNIQVAALKRLEKTLGSVQYEMARSKHLMSHFLPSSTLEFIGRSFTFNAIEQAVGRNVIFQSLDHGVYDLIQSNDDTTLSVSDRIKLGHKHGAEILKHFIDAVHADLRSWVDLDRRNKGGRPSDIYREYVIQRLAGQSSLITGEHATMTAGGKFQNLCVAALPACGFSSTGIERAIEAALGKMKDRKRTRRRKPKAKPKRRAPIQSP